MWSNIEGTSSREAGSLLLHVQADRKGRPEGEAGRGGRKGRPDHCSYMYRLIGRGGWIIALIHTDTKGGSDHWSFYLRIRSTWRSVEKRKNSR